jgi:uncharacterized membrane protein YjjP (DUF1212 family)
MDYNMLLDLATNLAYRQAMAGAETFRVEECVNHIMAAYGLTAEVFSIPTSLIVNIETPEGESLTTMRRIGFHGNDIDAVERYNNLSRKICSEKPDPHIANQWLTETDKSIKRYGLPLYLLGHAMGALGFCYFFGGSIIDSLCASVCGILIGLINHFLSKMKVNPFFNTIVASFLMSITAYGFSNFGINADMTIVGAIMILVPGLLFTNALRDIIFGDTNSGTNRTVQVLLTAAAIALGTTSAYSVGQSLWGIAAFPQLTYPGVLPECIAALVACTGFLFIFNVHGYGSLLCLLGSVFSWLVFSFAEHFGANAILASFAATIAAAGYAEVMARIRKYPALPYLVISILPLLPGAGIYYTANSLVLNDMHNFGVYGRSTVAIAGAMAVGILMVSTIVRLWTVWYRHKKTKTGV